MEIFHESNREKFLWMGFHPKHGWVILDRLLHHNKANHKTGNHLYFVRCMDWTIYKEEKSNWGEPNYIFVINYLENLDESKKKESVCWSCHDTVDNKYDYECSSCGWIICSNCGACKQFGC